MSQFAIGIRLSWLVMLGYWAWSARGVKRAAVQESLLVRFFAYVLPLVAASLLLGPVIGSGSRGYGRVSCRTPTPCSRPALVLAWPEPRCASIPVHSWAATGAPPSSSSTITN